MKGRLSIMRDILDEERARLFRAIDDILYVRGKLRHVSRDWLPSNDSSYNEVAVSHVG